MSFKEFVYFIQVVKFINIKLLILPVILFNVGRIFTGVSSFISDIDDLSPFFSS